MPLSRFSVAPVCLGLLALTLARPSPAQITVPDDFATIQAAVDAAGPGGRIVIRTGSYVEQVLITNKTLTLRGEPGATLVAPAAMVQTLLPFTARRPILTIRDAVVHLNGLSFDGGQSGLANLGLSGAYYLAASGTVLDCSFTGFRGATPGAVTLPSALQVMNPEDAGGPVQSVLLAGNSVRDSEIGIIVKGDTEEIPATFDPNAARLTATIQKNLVVGIASWPVQQLGILSQWGVRSTIVDNDVTGVVGGGPAGLSVALLVGSLSLPIPFLHPPSVVVRNRVSGSTIAILALNSKRVGIIGNLVVGGLAPGAGGIGVSGEDNIIAANQVDMSAAAGDVGVLLFGLESGGPTFVLGKAQGTKVIGNTIIGAAVPIWEQTGTSGTKLIANTIVP